MHEELDVDIVQAGEDHVAGVHLTVVCPAHISIIAEYRYMCAKLKYYPPVMLIYFLLFHFLT